MKTRIMNLNFEMKFFYYIRLPVEHNFPQTFHRSDPLQSCNTFNIQNNKTTF